MRSIDEFANALTGEGGRREIEMPGVETDAQAAAREAIEAPVRQRESAISDIRAQIQSALIDQALGINVNARLQELRAAYDAIRN